MERKQKTPCTSCKILSIGCLFVIGSYFIKLGAANKPKYIYRLIGAGTIALGTGEIFDYSPFRKNKAE